MLQKAHTLLRNGKNVKIGCIETHKRLETQVVLESLTVIKKQTITHKGKELEKMFKFPPKTYVLKVE